MKKHLLFIIFFLSSTLYTQSGFSENIAEEIKKAREASRSRFKQKTNEIQNCTEEINHLSSKITHLKQDISEKALVCKALDNADQFKECTQLKKKAIDKIKNLAKMTVETRERCLLFEFSPILTKIDSIIPSMQSDLSSMNDQYQRLVEYKKEQKTSRKIEHDKDKYFDCRGDIWTQSSVLVDWYLPIKTAHRTGNLYYFKKGMSALKIINDAIATQAQICLDINISNDKEVQENLEEIKQEIKDIKETVQENQAFVDELTPLAQDVDFDQWSKKYCEYLKNERELDLDLCENPINNPSWMYSVHYLSYKFFFQRADEIMGKRK